jgi:hypothetical protein
MQGEIASILKDVEPFEFTLDDWFDLGHSDEDNRYFCMVFQTFLDDSGHRAEKLMVSAGFCAKREVWRKFEADWKKCLGRHGLGYFKSSECNHVSGQFAKLRKGKYAQEDEKAEAREIRAEFLKIVAKHRGIVGVGVVVEMEPYQQLASLPGAKNVLPQNPYKAALSSVMFETVKRVRSRDRNCMVHFTHDDGERENLGECYQAFRRMNHKTAKHLGGFGFGDDKLIVGLQMADLLANHTAYIGSKSMDQRVALLEMRENIAFLARWDEEYISAVLKHGLSKHGKPIPFEIEE